MQILQKKHWEMKYNKKNGIECKPIKPNYQIRLQYSNNIWRMMNEYWNNLYNAAIEIYTHNYKFAWDAKNNNTVDNVVKIITAEFATESNNINKIYSKFFKLIPTNYTDQVYKTVYKDIKNSVKRSIPEKSSLLVVNFSAEAKKALVTKDALIKSNVASITGISKEMEDQINKSLLDALMRGRDRDYLKEQLKQLNHAKFSEKRIKLIAKDQINKATESIDTARRLDMGINYAVWKHSYLSKEPRKSHEAAAGDVYDLSKGCLIDGKYIYPAQEYGCNCYSAPFIPYL